jgi:phage baseplate assembly protein V
MALTTSQRLEALERQMAQIVIRGKVELVDCKKQRARVRYGENQLTPWLRWKPIRAGRAIIWWPLEVGEAVTVLSPGDLQLGEILPSSYSAEHSAPSDDPDLCIVQFGDGSEVRHNRATGDYAATYTGKATITVGGDTTIKSTGAVNVQSDAKDIRLNNGAGVVTGECICSYTGNPHSDVSAQVKAGK